jgi:hypothetical protein
MLRATISTRRSGVLIAVLVNVWGICFLLLNLCNEQLR